MKPFLDPRSLNASIQVTLSLFTLDPFWANRDHVRLVQIVFIGRALFTARFFCEFTIHQLLLSVVVFLFSYSLLTYTLSIYSLRYLLYATILCAMQDRVTPGMIHPKTSSFLSNGLVQLHLNTFCFPFALWNIEKARHKGTTFFLFSFSFFSFLWIFRGEGLREQSESNFRYSFDRIPRE